MTQHYTNMKTILTRQISLFVTHFLALLVIDRFSNLIRDSVRLGSRLKYRVFLRKLGEGSFFLTPKIRHVVLQPATARTNNN